jgi:hypothetical protein
MWMCSTRLAPDRRAHFLLFLEPAPPAVDHDAFACGQLHAPSRVVLLDHGHTYMDNEIVRYYSAMYCVPLPRSTASVRVDDHGDLLGYIRLGKLSASFKIKYFTTSISS